MTLDKVYIKMFEKSSAEIRAFSATYFIECNLYGPRGYLVIGQ